MIYHLEAHGVAYQIEAAEGSRVARNLRQGVPYEAPLLEHIYDQGFRGLAVDVGAHIGNHALYFAAVCKLWTVAFEPIFHHEFEANLARNPGLPLRLERFALGAAAGFAEPVGASSQRAPADEWGGTMELRSARGALKASSADYGYPMRTLDSFGLLGVSFIKIDVEGMEVDVIRGGLETIERDRPVLFLEARDQEAHDELEKLLAPLGYQHTLTCRTSTPVERWER